MSKLAYFPPPVVAIALISAAYAADRMLPGLNVVPATTGGIAWLASGFALTASAAWQFRQLKTTLMPHGTPQQLVTLGAYLWTRNPMYLGLLTILIGCAFYVGTLPFWLLPPAFFMIVNKLHIPYEEAKLSGTFGSDYDRYQDRVRRWI